MSTSANRNLEIDLRDAAENLLVYTSTGAVLLPIETGRVKDGPEFVVAGTLSAIRKLLETVK